MEHGSVWIRDLRLDTPQRLAPVCRDETVARAVALLGRDAVDWAVHQANEIAEDNIAAFPQVGGGPAQLDTLRLGVESATLTVLECLYEGRMIGPDLPQEAESQVRDFVHRRIPLTDQWAMIRQGHASLVQKLMNACVRLADPGEQSEQLLLVTKLAFEFIDIFASEVAHAYEVEQHRVAESAVISREAALRSLLDGEPADMGDLSIRLQYDVAFRWHIALVFSRGTPGQWDDLLTLAARDAMTAVGTRQILLVPQGHAVLWAFGNSASPIGRDWSWSPPTSVRVAVGDPAKGAEGLRTSHRQAVIAHKLARYRPGSAAVVTYRDVNLLSLLLADPHLAREFIDYELRDLRAHDAATSELRRTLAVYLDSHNTQATATSLFLARNTVTYRLRKAEALLGHPISERQLETRIALYLSELAHPPE